MVIRPDTSNFTSIGAPLRQVVLEFRIPDPAPILAACSDDKVLRDTRRIAESVKPMDKFIVDGNFIELPASLTRSDTPKLILQCSEGKLIRQYGLVRSILWNGGVKIDMVIDGGIKKRATAAIAEPLQTRYSWSSTCPTSRRYFRSVV